jgi:hypothetical protein
MLISFSYINIDTGNMLHLQSLNYETGVRALIIFRFPRYFVEESPNQFNLHYDSTGTRNLKNYIPVHV